MASIGVEGRVQPIITLHVDQCTVPVKLLLVNTIKFKERWANDAQNSKQEFCDNISFNECFAGELDNFSSTGIVETEWEGRLEATRLIPHLSSEGHFYKLKSCFLYPFPLTPNSPSFYEVHNTNDKENSDFCSSNNGNTGNFFDSSQNDLNFHNGKFFCNIKAIQ